MTVDANEINVIVPEQGELIPGQRVLYGTDSPPDPAGLADGSRYYKYIP